ncbi:MAG: DUF4249 family protein [Flavobacteriales bacterium]|nr:DUF4249 family protein [Flavobacteriales bacterium]
MKIFNYLFIAALIITLFSCDNEVDLNGDFEETPVVFGLLDHGADTQFVRITKTFLKDGANAIELASDPNNLYYDSLDVSLSNEANGQIISLKKLNVAKKPGVFTSLNNRVYYTNQNVVVGNRYKINIKRPDGVNTHSSTLVLGDVRLDKPDVSRNQEISFVNNVLNLQDYSFKFEISKDIAKFEAVMYFLYGEKIGNDTIPREVKIPIGSFTNGSLTANDDIALTVTGQRFIETIANTVAPTNTKKIIPTNESIRIEVFAADETFIFYQDLNGPIDGIAQVRPEYTNIENGIGLFASRSTAVFYANLQINTKSELVGGDYTKNHGFSY